MFDGLQILSNTTKHIQTRSNSTKRGAQTVKCLVTKQCLMVFGRQTFPVCLWLISIDFNDFVSPSRMRRYIKHSRQCLTTFSNTSFVKKNSAARRIFNSLLGVWKCGQTLSFVFYMFVLFPKPDD